MSLHLAKPEHELAYQDICKLVNKHADNVLRALVEVAALLRTADRTQVSAQNKTSRGRTPRFVGVTGGRRRNAARCGGAGVARRARQEWDRSRSAGFTARGTRRVGAPTRQRRECCVPVAVRRARYEAVARVRLSEAAAGLTASCRRALQRPMWAARARCEGRTSPMTLTVTAVSQAPSYWS